MKKYKHGTRRCYRENKCRDPRCIAANTQWQQERAKARACGDWNGIVEARDALMHIKQLQKQGMSQRAIAAEAGINPRRIQEIVDGHKKRICRRTEKKILGTRKPHGDTASPEKSCGD